MLIERHIKLYNAHYDETAAKNACARAFAGTTDSLRATWASGGEDQEYELARAHGTDSDGAFQEAFMGELQSRVAASPEDA